MKLNKTLLRIRKTSHRLNDILKENALPLIEKTKTNILAPNLHQIWKMMKNLSLG